MYDYRDFASPQFDNFDEKTMTATVEFWEATDDGKHERPVTHTVRCDFGVCPSCDGRGSYVNPNIDRHGISADDFHDDPGFHAAYFRGDYDVTCGECNGKRVVPVLSDCNDRSIIDALEEDAEAECAYAMERAAERAMGC